MGLEPAFWVVLVASLTGLLLSVAVEQMMQPRPLLARPAPAWCLHGGVWLLAHGALTLLLGRPWFAAAAVLAGLLVLVLVNNAKFKALREPFVWPDFEYFTDAIRHPRLYIPFLGWGKFLLAALAVVAAVALGLWGEAVPAARLDVAGQWGGVAGALFVALLLLWVGAAASMSVCFEAERDVVDLGLVASLWLYAQESARLPSVTEGAVVVAPATPTLPHLVAVQSESFFDARTLHADIREEVLAEFDRLKAGATLQGKLMVPAWGANTVRSEFAFLSGLDQSALGVHRFNPYRAVAKGWTVQNLAGMLRELGYRTVAIHPYPASFYQRQTVYPRLGFDEFLDIEAFTDAERFGPYVSDAAVTRKIEEVIAEADGPVFVFAVTMENHGPLHLERVAAGDVDALYREPPPAGCEDLTIYLRHLRNADRMVGQLRRMLETCGKPAGLCWFGDHVPIMPRVYETFGAPAGDVDYVLWRTGYGEGVGARCDLAVHELGRMWLDSVTERLHLTSDPSQIV